MTDFKVAAAKLVTEQGYGNKAAALSLGVPPSTMQHRARRHGRPRPAPPLRPDRIEGRLRQEVRRLTMEREVLKKATASFAGERA